MGKSPYICLRFLPHIHVSVSNFLFLCGNHPFCIKTHSNEYLLTWLLQWRPYLPIRSHMRCRYLGLRQRTNFKGTHFNPQVIWIWAIGGNFFFLFHNIKKTLMTARGRKLGHPPFVFSHNYLNIKYFHFDVLFLLPFSVKGDDTMRFQSLTSIKIALNLNAFSISLCIPFAL